MRLQHEMLQQQRAMDAGAMTLTPMFRDEGGRFVPVPPELLSQLPAPVMMQPAMMAMPHMAPAAMAPHLPPGCGGPPIGPIFEASTMFPGGPPSVGGHMTPTVLGPTGHVVPPFPPPAMMHQHHPVAAQLTPQDQRIVARIRAVRLPDYWKATKTDVGEIYFYHTITREVTWDLPEEDTTPTDLLHTRVPLAVKAEVPQLTQLMQFGEPELAVMSGEAKGVKERFMSEISQFIVNILTPYRRDDCPRARITNDEDFRKLARKMTHAVLGKELRQCKRVEGLVVNEAVKLKTKDFVAKYMTKFGDVFVYNSRGRE